MLIKILPYLLKIAQALIVFFSVLSAADPRHPQLSRRCIKDVMQATQAQSVRVSGLVAHPSK